MGVDQLALTAGGAGEWAVEETDDVGCQLEDAAGLSLEADADAPAAALGPGAQLTGHADEGAGGGVGVLGAPADSPPERQARDRRLGDLRGRNRVEDRRQPERVLGDRKSTRLNSSHGYISYAVFCLKKKKKTTSHSRHRDKVEECVGRPRC